MAWHADRPGGDRARARWCRSAPTSWCSRWRPRSCARSTSPRARLVHKGDILAQLDPTFAAADVGALRGPGRQPAGRGRPATGRGRGPAVSCPDGSARQPAAGGDLRPAPGRAQLQARELPPEDQQPAGRPCSAAHRRRAGLYRSGSAAPARSRTCAASSNARRRQQAEHAGRAPTAGWRSSAASTQRRARSQTAQRDLDAMIAERDGYEQQLERPRSRSSSPSRAAS